MLKKTRFSTRIALVFSGITMLSIIIISLASFSIARTTLLNRTQDFIDSALHNEAKAFNLLLASAQNNADSVADEIELTLNYRRYNQEDQYRSQYLKTIEGALRLSSQINSSRSAFAAIFRSDGTIDNIWFKDNNRDGIPELQESQMLPQRVDFERLQGEIQAANRIFWSVENQSAGFFTVYITIYEDDALKALVGSDISIDSVKRQLENANYLKTGQMWLVSQVGDPLVTNNDSQSLVTTRNEYMGIMDKEGERFYQAKDNLWTFMDLSNGWRLVSKVALSNVLEGLYQITNIIVATFILVTALTLIAAIPVSRRIAEPYRYLSETISQIGTGNYAVEIDRRFLLRADEAGTLSRAIKTTQEQLLDNFNAIKEAKDNLEVAVSVRTAELSSANQQLEAILIDMRETQNQLALTEKMAALSRVLIGLSHNINTPLGNALTLVTYFEEKQQEILDALENKSLSQQALHQHLKEGLTISKHIFDNIQAGRSYIEKVSDISRSRQTLQPELIQLKQLIESQFILATANAAGDEPKLHMSFPEGLTLVASPQYLSEIVYELLYNAICHAKVPGQPLVITITAEHIDARGTLKMTVCDNGRGLSGDALKEIFTPLYTSQLNMRPGLGLSRIYGLVTEVFSGSIQVRNQVPQGSCFDLELSCKPHHSEQV